MCILDVMVTIIVVGCFNSATVQQRGTVRYSSVRQVIVPQANFTCNGRITGVVVSMNRVFRGESHPYLEVWHPTTPGSDLFDKVGEVELVESEIIQVGHDTSTAYWLVDITLNGSDRIEFKAGDVIGYYQPPDTSYEVWSIRIAGYTTYHSKNDPSINTSHLADYIAATNRQPLIRLTIGT